MKRCSRCKETKSEEEFYARGGYCKQCKSEYSKDAWANGGDYKVSNYEAKQRRVQAAHDYIWELFNQSSCADCGETNPIVFEFDHVTNDKFKNISTMISSNYGLESIKKEISKCEVVCANCHKIRTSARGNHWRYKLNNISLY